MKKPLKAIKEYFNTTGETKYLEEYKSKAKAQNIIIYNYLKDREATVGASYLYKVLFKESIPITSIRRALNTLENKGKVKKSIKGMGMYGRNEYYYKAI